MQKNRPYVACRGGFFLIEPLLYCYFLTVADIDTGGCGLLGQPGTAKREPFSCLLVATVHFRHLTDARRLAVVAGTEVFGFELSVIYILIFEEGRALG